MCSCVCFKVYKPFKKEKFEFLYLGLQEGIDGELKNVEWVKKKLQELNKDYIYKTKMYESYYEEHGRIVQVSKYHIYIKEFGSKSVMNKYF